MGLEASGNFTLDTKSWSCHKRSCTWTDGAQNFFNGALQR